MEISDTPFRRGGRGKEIAMSLYEPRLDTLPTESEMELELQTLRRILDYLTARIASYESCHEAEKVLAGIWSAREVLGRMEALIHDRHLSCCLIPSLRGPSDLAMALSRLRDRRIGATIVCEHQRALDTLAERGVPIGTPVSVNALESIFARGSRLRDGAAIVRGDWLIAAGVPLPIGASKDERGVVLSDRQRRALALSRITDALVLVVEDHTGEIFVALDGHLRPAGPIGAVSTAHPDPAEG
jgi:DNA integrity scanning protein DisA with diadenylate cyclase activity